MYVVLCMYPFNHSYVFGFGCNRKVLCSVVSSEFSWYMLVYVVICRMYMFHSILVGSVLLLVIVVGILLACVG